MSVTEDTWSPAVEDKAGTPPSAGNFLMGLLRQNLGRVVLACLLASIAGAIDLSAFWILYLLTRELLASEPQVSRLLILSGLLPIAAILRLLVLGGSSILAHSIGFATACELRVRLLRNLRSWNLGRTEGQTAKLKKTVSDYPSEIEHFIAHTIPDTVAGITTLLIAIVLLILVDWRMAIVSLALIPIAVGAQLWAYRIFAGMTGPWFAADRKATAALLSYVRGIATIKAFNRTANSLREVRGAIDTLMDLSRTAMRESAIPFAIFFTAVSGSLALVGPAALYLYRIGEIGLPEVILFVTLGAQTTAPLLRLLFANGAMQRLTVATRSISLMLDEPGVPPAKIAKTPDRADITFDNVCFGYSAPTNVIRNVDLVLPEGRVSAIVGPSGAGKSTLLRLIARFWDVGSGSVRIGGIDVREIEEEDLQRLVSVVFQDPYLFHDTVRENLIMAAPHNSADDIDRAIAAAGLSEVVRGLPHGLDTSVGDRGLRFSSGERQRLSIARALLKDAPILLLDEATAFADPENELAVQHAIAHLTVGRTVVVVAHRLATVQSSDLIAVMNDGEIEAFGKHLDLLGRSATYDDLWASQQRAMAWFLSAPETGKVSC